MKCPSENDWLRFEAEELTVDVARAMEEHANGCPTCRTMRGESQQLIEDLGPNASTPERDEAFVNQVLIACEKADEAPAPSPRSRNWAPWTALALAAGIALYIGVAPSKVDVGGRWAARGRPRTATEEIGVEVVVVHGGRALPTQGATLRPGDGFGVSYWKTTKEPAYLMAFALDAAGSVHWIYPAYPDSESEPAAVPLATSEKRLLDEVFEPDSPAPGPLHVAAIVSNEPLSIKTIEKRIIKGARETRVADIAKLVPNARVVEWDCRWSP